MTWDLGYPPIPRSRDGSGSRIWGRDPGSIGSDHLGWSTYPGSMDLGGQTPGIPLKRPIWGPKWGPLGVIPGRVPGGTSLVGATGLVLQLPKPHMCLYGTRPPVGLCHGIYPSGYLPRTLQKEVFGVRNGSQMGVPNRASRGPDTQIWGPPDLYRSSYRITVDPIEPPKHVFRLFGPGVQTPGMTIYPGIPGIWSQMTPEQIGVKYPSLGHPRRGSIWTSKRGPKPL